MGFEAGAAGWKAQTNPLSYGGTRKTLDVLSQSVRTNCFFWFFLKKWAIPGLFFLYFRLFNTQLTVNKCSIYI